MQALRQPTRQQRHAHSPAGGADPVCPQQLFQEVPSVSRHPRRCFDSFTASRGGKDFRTPVRPRTRWCYCGTIQDALGGTPSWERDMDLHLSRSHILRYWAGTPDQHRQTNRLYRRMRIGAAQRELSRNNGERFLAPGYACVTRAEWLRRYRDTVLPKGAHFWYKGDDGLWWLGKVSARTADDGVYLVRFWTIRGRLNSLFPRRGTQPRRGPYEVLGVYRFMPLARSLKGSNVM